MAKLRFDTYALMLAVLLWGVLLGGVVYSNSFVMPAFLSDLPSSAVVVNGPYAINEAPFWMAIHPLVVLSTLIALIANWRNLARRKMIAVSLGVYVVVLVVTAVYFVPELLAFAASPQSNVSAAEWAPRASRWRLFSWVRAGVMFAIFLPVLFALVTEQEDMPR